MSISQLKSLAETGDAAALVNLGVCYAMGQLCQQDLRKAQQCFRKAANQEDADAQFNLALCYLMGTGVRKDLAQAVVWFRKAALQGHAEAMFNLASCYSQGHGVAANAQQALSYNEAAAKLGHARALYNLALHEIKLAENMEDDEDEEQDEQDAAFKRGFDHCYAAAVQGLSEAQFGLAECYEMGQGCEQDTQKALENYQLALTQGHPHAEAAILELSKSQ